MSPATRFPAQLAILSTRAELPTLARLAVAFAVMVTKWDQNRRTRQTLNGLSQHELKDIGLTSSEARREANKRFYQL